VVPGGKSELRRAGCRVIPGGAERNFSFSESATENIPPYFNIIIILQSGKGEMAG